jgi:hypothetical protein
VDRKPPRQCADERATLLALLQYQRESLVRKADGVPEERADSSPVPSGTSLRWLLNHMADAEHTWLSVRFAGTSGDDPPPAPTLGAAVDRYRRRWAVSDGIIAGASFDDLAVAPGSEGPVNLRWVLAHLLQETARHAGHADIVREVIDGAIGR